MEERTLVEIFQNREARYGSRTALKVKRDGAYTDISWSEFGDSVRSFALGLIALGVERGDRVAVLSENRPEWHYADMAVLCAAAITVPIYDTTRAKDVQYILDNCGAKAVVVSTEQQLRKVLDVRRNLESLETIVVMDPPSPPGAPGSESDRRGVLTFSDLLELGSRESKRSADAFAERAASVEPDDVASIVYTSGTTGEPKGVVATHGNFLHNVKVLAKMMGYSEDDVFLSVLPLSHVFERAGCYTVFYGGGVVAYAESREALAENMLEVRPTGMCAVPRVFEKIHAKVIDSIEAGGRLKRRLFYWAVSVGARYNEIKLARKTVPFLLRLRRSIAHRLVFRKLQKKLGGRFRFFASGGAPLAKEIGEFFNSVGIRIIEGYGLTETVPVLTVNPPDRLKFGTVGKPIPGVELKLSQSGEILARGPNIMRGYYQSESHTQEAFTASGWFQTGDIGQFDQSGFLMITDRKKDLIVTAGGKNVAPQKIEGLLKTDRYIADVVVIGDKRPFLSALIVPDFVHLRQWAEGAGIDSAEITSLLSHPEVVAFYRKRLDVLSVDLASFETIKRFTLLPKELAQEDGELTPTLKVKRKAISERYAQEIQAMYD